MCDLCSKDPIERKRGEEANERLAVWLEGFAYKLRQMNKGHIRPHSHEASIMALDTKVIIRMLVEEWL
jgi:hypothetical protein